MTAAPGGVHCTRVCVFVCAHLRPSYLGTVAPQAAVLYDRLLHFMLTLPSQQKQLLSTWIAHDLKPDVFVPRLLLVAKV